MLEKKSIQISLIDLVMLNNFPDVLLTTFKPSVSTTALVGSSYYHLNSINFLVVSPISIDDGAQ